VIGAGDARRVRLAVADIEHCEKLLERTAANLEGAAVRGPAHAVERQRARLERLRRGLERQLVTPADFSRVWRETGGVL
jgi:hypothetical protein